MLVKQRRRAAIMATILCTLLLPTVGSNAGQRERLEQLEERREKLDASIDRHEAKADTLQAEAKALNKKMIDYRTELAKLDKEIADIQSKVRTAQAQIDATQARIDKIEGVATEQAVALYKQGSVDVLDALLDSESLGELDDKVELLGVAAQQNTTELIQYGRYQVLIEAQHLELFNTKKDLEATREHQSKILADLSDTHEQLKVKLAQIEEKLGHEHAEEGDLMVAMTRIKSDIQAAQAVRSVVSRGTSTQGYIWPLNGSITSYYGPRWGRMHTGIDIDGTTGQPVVSSKEGRVIMASSYSGYGNCVIIDHGGGISTLYAHLSSFNVSAGQDVPQGEVVGNVGCTGSCTGDHLHFEVRVNGNPVDPLDYLP